MRTRTLTLLALTASGLVACGNPTATAPTEISTDRILEGQTVNAITGGVATGVTVQIGTRKGTTTDGLGYFRAEVDGPGTYPAVVAGPTVVERRTTVTGPTPVPARLSLIPTTFDLRAFDEMFRTSNARLQRWTTNPALVVLGSVMSYKGVEDTYSATAEQISDQDVGFMIEDLTTGLSLLTGSTYTTFAAISVERPASGQRISVTRPGAIVVGRYNGILTFAQTIGFGRWAEEPGGSVNGGAVFLDSGFDRDDSRRRLLRVHELGHALGYLHVNTRVSIMNPAIGPEPNEFDRTGAIVAFDRPPGNVSPDTDPAFASGNPSRLGGSLRWTTVVGCSR